MMKYKACAALSLAALLALGTVAQAEAGGTRVPGSRLPNVLIGLGLIALGVFLFIGMLAGQQKREVVVTPTGLPVPMPLIPLLLLGAAGIFLITSQPQDTYVMDGVRYALRENSASALGPANGADVPEKLTLPGTVDGLALTSVSGFGGSGVVEVTLPGSVKEIRDNAFKGCASLQRVWRTGSDDVPIHIGDAAFRDCLALTGLAGMNRIYELGAGAFQNCAALETVVVTGGSDHSVEIKKEAFRGCSALRKAYLPCVNSLGERAFAECPSLERLEAEIIHGNMYKNTFEGSGKVVVCTDSDWTVAQAHKAGVETAPAGP
jgi:hypothetical protein